MIFDSPEGRYPTVEELVICDLFRNIDLREMRGPCVSVNEQITQHLYSSGVPNIIFFTFSQSFQPGLSTSTLSLLNAVRRRQGASIGGSFSEGIFHSTDEHTTTKIKEFII
jgi:PX domain-containing protein kinase-like protein